MTTWQRLIFRLLVTTVVLQVCITKLLIMAIIQRIPGRSMLEQKLVKQLPLQIQLGIQAFETYVVPAIQEINRQGEDEAKHRRKLQQGILEVIKHVPADRQADLLENLQAQEYEGVVALLDSIFNGYAKLVDSVGANVAKVALVEKTPAEGCQVKAELKL